MSAAKGSAAGTAVRAGKRDARVQRHGPWQWQVAQELGERGLPQALRDPDALLGDPVAGATVRFLKQDTSTSVAAVGEPAEWVVKRYNPRKWANPLKDLVRGPAAKRAFEAGRSLAAKGVATAPVVAWGVRRRWGLPVCSCLVSEYLAGTTALVEHLKAGPAEEVLEAVADMLAKMHAAGFANRDLKAHNILVRRAKPGAGAQAYLVDLDGLRWKGRVSRRRRQKNLRRLRRSFLEHAAAGAAAWKVLERYYHRRALA